jgi:hypothetical protein
MNAALVQPECNDLPHLFNCLGEIPHAETLSKGGRDGEAGSGSVGLGGRMVGEEEGGELEAVPDVLEHMDGEVEPSRVRLGASSHAGGGRRLLGHRGKGCGGSGLG